MAGGLTPLLPKPPAIAFSAAKLPNYAGVHFAGLLFARAGAEKLKLADLLTQADRFFADADANRDDVLRRTRCYW